MTFFSGGVIETFGSVFRARHILTVNDIDYDSESDVPHGGGAIIHAAIKRVPDLTACIGPDDAKSAARMLWCMASHLYFHAQLVGALLRSVLEGITTQKDIRTWEPSTWVRTTLSPTSLILSQTDREVPISLPKKKHYNRYVLSIESTWQVTKAGSMRGDVLHSYLFCLQLSACKKSGVGGAAVGDRETERAALAARPCHHPLLLQALLPLRLHHRHLPQGHHPRQCASLPCTLPFRWAKACTLHNL